MIYDVEKRITAIHNELKAQKVYSGLTYSQLLLPENNPTQSYSGTASLSGSGDDPVARLRFRFTRADGIIDPPMVDFAMQVGLNPTYQQFAEDYGFVFNVNDLSYLTYTEAEGYIAELGDGYVDFYVDFDRFLSTQFFSLNTIGISATVQAIANVKGTLTVERLI